MSSYSYRDQYQLPPRPPPIPYEAMTDAQFARSINVTICFIIFLPWLVHRIYYSRLCFTALEDIPATYYTKELGMMVISLIGWGTAMSVVTAVDHSDLVRRAFVAKTAILPLLVYWGNLIYEDMLEAPIGYLPRAVLVFLGSYGLAFLIA